MQETQPIIPQKPTRPHLRHERVHSRDQNAKHAQSDYAVKYGRRGYGSDFELPARDERRAIVTKGELDGSFVTVTEPNKSEPVNSDEFDEPTADEVNDVINYHNQSSATINRIMSHPETHPLDNPHSREAWTYGDPAKVVPRIHSSEQPRNFQ